MGIELAWGRLRRSCLRRFRPAYVERMAAKRQGNCPNCPHNIIDARDLKFYRNVCGYRFAREDDPFVSRDRLGFARYGLAELVFFSLLAIGLYVVFGLLALWQPVFWLVVLAVLVGHLEVIYFFRDPERVIPNDPAALLSAADGLVTHVGEVDDPDFPGGKALRISVFLSIFNVHVNRLPRTGKVIDVRYFPGDFLDARHAECHIRNEQLWIDMEEAGAGRRIRVKQISGAIARRIVCWLKPGDEVRAGDRLGMIKFGSRTDVLIPAGLAVEVLVKVGDTVQGGSSILLRYTE